MAAVKLMSDEEVRAVPQAYEDGQAGFGALQSESGLFPLRSVKVSAKISALSSSITLEQTFLNSFDSPLEATYIFPLPSRAAVTSFRLEIKDRVVEGLIKERGEARREYTEAIQQGHRAAIAEEETSGVFTLRVGNIGAGELASVRLSLAAPLPFADGEATFRFPLVLAPRYIPGTPLSGPGVGSGTTKDTTECPDASRISPPVMLTGFPDPVQLNIEVEFDTAALFVSDVRSSLHTVMISDVEMGDSEAATSPRVAIRRLKLDPTGDRHLNRDFILRFHVAHPMDLTTSLVLSDDLDSESQEGTWQLTLIAPQGGGNGARTTPRDVVFVLDRSGSMSGWKMVAARSATARIVDTLTDEDRFSLIAFDNYVEYPPGHSARALLAATDYNRQAVVQFLGSVDARGGTEMQNPLNLAADSLQAAGPLAPSGFWAQRESGMRDRVLVLVTDGQVGNEDGILSQLAPKLQGVRIFTLGIDQSVNEAFLTRLAALAPAGACELVESQGRLENAMDRIHRLICTPAFADVLIDGPKGNSIEPIADTCVPSKAAAVFAGVPTVVSGRYRRTLAQDRGARAHFVTLSGKTAAGESWSQAVQGQQTLNPALSALWARTRINELDDRFTVASTSVEYYYNQSAVQTPNPDKPDELRASILALSLRFKVLCRFSAFVAVDRAEKVETDGSQLLHVTQPVESPAGWGSTLGGARLRSASHGSGRVQLQRARYAVGGASPGGLSGSNRSGGYERAQLRLSRACNESSVRSGLECYVARPKGFGAPCAPLPAYPPGAIGSSFGGSACDECDESSDLDELGGGTAGTSLGAPAPYAAPPSLSAGAALGSPAAKKTARESKAPAQTPERERARSLVSACLRTVHQILRAKQVGETLLKQAVTEMQELLDHMDKQWQSGQSLSVLKDVIWTVEEGGKADRGLWEKVKAALEHIEQAVR